MALYGFMFAQLCYVSIQTTTQLLSFTELLNDDVACRALCDCFGVFDCGLGHAFMLRKD